jgi:hypothetical protein
MRVLLSPSIDEWGPSFTADLAGRLAGGDGEVLPLRGLGAPAFRRPLSSGETHLLRWAILGLDPGLHVRTDEAPATVVGYVCAGRRIASNRTVEVVAVADHVNLTWRSPLTGLNDDLLGPRFPVVAGVYVPEMVVERVGSGVAPPVGQEVVAGVQDDRSLLEFESQMVRKQGLETVSSELVPVALLAAHMGIRLAAVVVITGSD